MLEQLISLESLVHKRIEKSYFIAGDLERLSASTLYSDEKIVDLNSSNFQMHFHEDKEGNIANAKFKDYKQNTLKDLTNYEAAMGDFYAQRLNLSRINKGSIS